MQKTPFLFGLLAALLGCAAPQGTVQMAQRADSLPQLTALPVHSFAPQSAPPPTRSNTSIAADFMALSFQMESGRPIPSLSRFEGPITVATLGPAPPNAQRDLAQLLSRLRQEAGLPINATKTPANASITVEFLPRAQMQAVVPHAACFVVPRVSNWQEFRAARNTPMLDWTTLTTRERAAIFIPSDVAPQEQRDCLHEELGQALGPLNDLYHLSDSVFNDDNFNTTLTGFDMLILRATYAPELRSGLTPPEVHAKLPALLARLNPKGGRAAPAQAPQTPRDWTSAIEGALSQKLAPPLRRAAAKSALSIATSNGWTDNRRAFSHFVYARLIMSTDPASATTHFADASRLYAKLPNGASHLLHVDMQMAALSLGRGDLAAVDRLTKRALPLAKSQQNAAVFATLKFLAAASAQSQGRLRKAQTMRLDSLPIARYGFGSEAQVRKRMSEVEALAHPTPLARN